MWRFIRAIRVAKEVFLANAGKLDLAVQLRECDCRVVVSYMFESASLPTSPAAHLFAQGFMVTDKHFSACVFHHKKLRKFARLDRHKCVGGRLQLSENVLQFLTPAF